MNKTNKYNNTENITNTQNTENIENIKNTKNTENIKNAKLDKNLSWNLLNCEYIESYGTGRKDASVGRTTIGLGESGRSADKRLAIGLGENGLMMEGLTAGSCPGRINRTIMQYFEWYLPNDGIWWRRCSAKAEKLAEKGVTDVWLPPAYKAVRQDDVGYAVYDLYDLGEFRQKGTVRTKYGTKDEYVQAVKDFRSHGIRVYADIVLNHRLDGDEVEAVEAYPVAHDDRTRRTGEAVTIHASTRFTCPGRNGKYSSFVWDHRNFDGTDHNVDEDGPGTIYLFKGKSWEEDTDDEFGNFDYLLGHDVDMTDPSAVSELRRWLGWYIDETGVEALRLDAVKHISANFYRELLAYIRKEKKQELPAVGEYWSGDLQKLLGYLDSVDNSMALFDICLHFNFFEASMRGAEYDMRTILDGTLLSERPENAVTFVDNHDTQEGQSLQSYVGEWFKQLAYAIILLRAEGTPCVFYSDYYGNFTIDKPGLPNLSRMIKLRRSYAYGEQEDYFDDPNRIGWVRRGDADYPDSGLAVVMSNGEGGSKRMFMGSEFVGARFFDVLEKCQEAVVIDDEGWGEFRTEGGNVSVWARREVLVDIAVND